MYELDDRSRSNMLFALVTKGPRSEQHDERAQALAATHDDVLGNLGHQGDIAGEAFANQVVDRPHIDIGESQYFVDRRALLLFTYYVHVATDNARMSRGWRPESAGGRLKTGFASH